MYLMLSLATALGFGLALFVTVMSGNCLWLLIAPATLLFFSGPMLYFAEKEKKLLPFLRQAELFSPALRKAEPLYFYSYSAFQISAICAFLAFVPLFMDIPISCLLAKLGHYELAERVHSLDFAWGGINRVPLEAGTQTLDLNQKISGRKKQEEAIIKVYGANSVQFGLWQMKLGHACSRKTEIEKKKEFYRKAIVLLNVPSEADERLSLKSLLAILEAESGNKKTAKILVSKISDELGARDKDGLLLKDKIHSTVFEGMYKAYNLIGEHKSEKEYQKLYDLRRKDEERNYLLFGYLPPVERFVFRLCFGLGLIGSFFNLVNMAIFYFLYWKNTGIVNRSRNPQELIQALQLLIPIALYRRKRDLADEYSKRLVELMEKIS